MLCVLRRDQRPVVAVDSPWPATAAGHHAQQRRHRGLLARPVATSTSPTSTPSWPSTPGVLARWLCDASWRRRGSDIICITASASLSSVAPHPYSVSKAAALEVVCAVAGIWRAPVRVNAISPNYIPTPVMRIWAMVPAQRRAPPDRGGTSTRWALCWARRYRGIGILASDEAKYINGHNLVVDSRVTVGKAPNMPPAPAL
ncbi:hypothetical protein ZWY2020_012233 [Hordeum vulgare]|nr:hypothetical protein ZWY2020_012233 [Hordeum vulgare]